MKCSDAVVLFRVRQILHKLALISYERRPKQAKQRYSETCEAHHLYFKSSRSSWFCPALSLERTRWNSKRNLDHLIIETEWEAYRGETETEWEAYRGGDVTTASKKHDACVTQRGEGGGKASTQGRKL